MNRTLRWSILLISALAAISLAAPGARAQEHGDAHAPAATSHDAGHDATGDTHGAHGAHGEHGALVPYDSEGFKTGQVVAPAITALVTFGLVFVVLYTMVWPKISKGLDDRATKISDEIAAAELARKQAADALDEYEKNLADARAEAKAMIADTKAKQGELAAELRAKADAELSELRDRARQDIEAAKKAAINELYAESVALASQIAGKILQREVSVQDQQRLVQESLAEMQSNA